MSRKTANASTLDIQGTSVAVVTSPQGDYISLTDMLRAKDGDFFISDWLRNRNTVEFLGIWESIYNPGFNCGEFATIKSQAVLTNLESLNAVFIRQGLPAPERLLKLNEIAISQMRSLLADHHLKRLAR